MPKIGERSQQVYQYIADYIQEHGYSPTLREIAEALDISKTTAHYHVGILCDWRYLSIEEYKSRAIGLME